MLGTVGRGGNAQARAASGALMPYLLPACFGRRHRTLRLAVLVLRLACRLCCMQANLHVPEV